MPTHLDNYLADPFNAIAKVRIPSKTTITLAELNATDLPPLVHEEEELEQEEQPEEEEDPFGRKHHSLEETDNEHNNHDNKTQNKNKECFRTSKPTRRSLAILGAAIA